jgi:ABC-type glutathione transport system ATPase component
MTGDGAVQPDPFGGGRDEVSGVRLDELRDVPVVVVLGERGAGKSVALEQERGLLSKKLSAYRS